MRLKLNNYNGGYSTDDIIEKLNQTTARSYAGYNYDWNDDSESYSKPKPTTRFSVRIGDVYFCRKTYKHWVVASEFSGYSCKLVNTMDKNDTLYATETMITDMSLVIA